MKVLVIVATLYSLILCINCAADKKAAKFPSEFRFKLETITFSYDSQKKLYTRSYGSGDSSVVVPLTSQDLQRIFDHASKIDFMDFPGEFECAPESDVIMPSFNTTITLYYKKKQQKTTNSDGCSDKIDQSRADQFDAFALFIKQIIDSKTAVKNMRETDLIFM